MSKLNTPILILLFGCALAALAHASGRTRAEVRITIDPIGRTAAVEGQTEPSQRLRKNLSFLDSAVGVPDLGKRISNVLLRDEAGHPIGYRPFNSAEYVAESSYSTFQYSVDLSPATDPRAAAHASWVNGGEGLIYLDDLLPIGVRTVSVSVQLPAGWETITSERSTGKGRFEVDDTRRAVFAIGSSIRSTPPSRSGPAVYLAGKWLFTDAEAAGMTAEIFDEYRKTFGSLAGDTTTVVLLPMPHSSGPSGTWEAETRGSTVVVTSTDMPFRTQSLQRLHEQLRHELFHLWVPNAVNLTGKYDWFYEGFALYQSLKTGVALNRIRFEDMLDTLSRAHNIDKSQATRQSLVEASDGRWAGAETLVYARGMIVAFLTDLEMMRASGGKQSVEMILRIIYSENSGLAKPSDGNTELLKVYNNDPATAAIARSYIYGAQPIDWDPIVGSAGLETEPGTSRTKLRIRSKLTGRQKAVLDKLGYNNWRKLTQK